MSTPVGPVPGNVLMGLVSPIHEPVTTPEPADPEPATAAEPVAAPEPVSQPALPMPDLASVQAALEVFRQVEAYLIVTAP